MDSGRVSTFSWAVMTVWSEVVTLTSTTFVGRVKPIRLEVTTNG